LASVTEFVEFGESCKFGECRLNCFKHVKYVFCAYNDKPYHVHSGEYSRTHVFARLVDICQTVLRGLAKLANTFSRVACQ
jgi:hypothetical protein